MKRLIPGLLSLGLLSIPVQAKADFVEDFFGGASSGDAGSAGYSGRHSWRHWGHRHHAHYWGHRHAAHHWGHRHLAYHSGHVRAAHQGGARHAGSFTAMTSWYAGSGWSEPNTHTANGERFNKWGLTAAHRTLPLGTRLLLSHGGRSVVVRVNDRGPAAWTGRSLDVSKGAAARLGLLQSGTGKVSVTILASR